MSYKAPEYTPLCNRHLRFYLSNPDRKAFSDQVAKRQFLAVQRAMRSMPEQEVEQLRTILLAPDRSRDLTDSYISRQLAALEYTEREINAFYQALSRINKQVAIILGYIPGKKATPVHWTEND